LEVAAGIAGRKQILPRQLHTEVRRILAVRRRVEGQGLSVLSHSAHTSVGHLVCGVKVPRPGSKARKDGFEP
jgi:hypothetical protein